MPLAKSKKTLGLGNSLMNDRFGKGKGSDRKKTSAITRTNHATGEQYLVNEKQDASWVKMRSVTEQGALDEFLATAELAGTDFTAEKISSIKIIHSDQKNPYLLSASEQRAALGKHRLHKASLTVPRRPKWDATTSPQELDALERDSFLNWRRSLAQLQENNDLLMTPFERNIEVWRQLWRVIERSDLVVQIVDARNPLLFRSEDLEQYVKAVDSRKENLLLINKADMMTTAQRRAWAIYLKKAGISYRFFSAHLAEEHNELRDRDQDFDAESSVLDPDVPDKHPQLAAGAPLSGEQDEQSGAGAATSALDDDDIDTQILTVDELEATFLQHAPADGLETDTDSGRKLQIGLVGYPNVGKSSTINALIGAKKVSVSSTPGKTKHFQTIHLSDRVILCDCPGLVFPNFAFSKADLVCNGVLPIDQMREYTGPVGLVTQRIPQPFLEAVYGIRIRTRPQEEGGDGIPTASELLRAYATARGFSTQGLGQPDESRAARYILKDYVNGKLLFVQPPPDMDDAKAFNHELYDPSHLPLKRRDALVAAATQSLSLEDNTAAPAPQPGPAPAPTGLKSEKLDAGFFSPGSAQGHLSMPFNHKYSQQAAASSSSAATAAKPLSGRKAKTMIALENGLQPQDAQLLSSSKKHFKGGARNGKGKKHRRAEPAYD